MIPQRHKLDLNSNRIPNLIDNATSSSYGNLIGSASTATIVTTKVGTFSSTWKGSGTLYFDPGDGGPIESLVLTTGGVAWNHAYPSAGNKTIRITGDLDGVKYLLFPSTSTIINSLGEVVSRLINLETLDIANNFIVGNFSAISGLINLITLYLYGNLISGDISAVSGLNNLNTLYIRNNNLSFTYTQFPPWSGNTYDLRSCVSTSQEVGDLILAAANGGMNNCIYKLDGTNPAPPSTQEVIDGISTLAGNGVTLYVST
jgi:Leucine-rich repeat (LRR) protein